MRFADLTLEKYGAFDRRTLTIPSGPGLTVVYGPNEAGKSTCLSGINDFLFGIPTQTDFGAIFGYDGMRISATLETATPTTMMLARRKGRGKTLVTPAGVGVDDAVLQSLLGSTTRDRFQALFGLNHHTLRTGGEHLLKADGEIGRLIVEAGGGLRSLMARLDEISDETDRLFSTRRNQNVAFYKLVDGFTEADEAVKAGTLSRDAYDQAQKALETATNALAALYTRKREVAQTVSSLERLVRVVPSLTELARIEAELASLAGGPALPADFDAQVATAIRDRAVAATAFTTAATELREFEERLKGLVFDDGIIGLEPKVRDATNAAILAGQQRKDRPGRIKELSEGEEKLASLKASLGIGLDDDLTDRLPSQISLDHVQDLVAEATALAPAMAAAQRQVDQLDRRVSGRIAKVEAAKAKGHDRPFGISATDLAALPSQCADLALKQRQADAAQKAVADAVSALGFGSVDDLARLPCPSMAVVQDERQARDRLEGEIGRGRATLQAAISARDAARSQIDRLTAGDPVPTDAVLAAERQRRDTAWGPVRESYLAGSTTDSREMRIDRVTTVENAIIGADRVADRKAVEAERIAGLSLAERALADAEAAIAAADGQVKDLVTALAARVAEVDQAFPDLVSRHPTLAGIASFLDRRDAIHGLQTTANTAIMARDTLAATIAPTLDLLARAEGKASLAPSAEHPIAARVQTVIDAISVHDEGHSDYRHDLKDLESDSQSLADHRADLERLKAEEAAWTTAWPAAVAAIGLPPTVTPAAATKVVAEWMAAPGVLGMIAQTQRRITRMDEDEAKLAATVATLASKITVPLPADPIAAVEMITALWAEADQIRQKRAALVPEVDALKVRVANRAEAVEAAQAVTGGLAEKAGVENDDDSLKAAAAQFRRTADLGKLRAETVKIITSAGDGLGIDLLRAATGDRDIDSLRADLAVATDDGAAIDGEIEAAIQVVQAQRTALERFVTDTGVNHAVARRESAIADLHRTVDRYLELTMAHEAITRAITRIRTEHQDPLIRRASALFASTTKSEFSGIETDIDAKGQPVVVGRRANGATVTVSAMSDGVRDQLFLAFRLASIEAYCQATEPLPFIADDILVHFDDPRSAATLDLLAEFGETTQVLLFTHHLSVRAAADALGGRAQVVELQ